MRTSKRILYCFCFFLTIASCKKKSGGDPVQPGPFPDPTDPAVASTIGFFLDGWQPQTFTAPSYLDASQPSTAASATITIDAATVITKIPRTVFGQNANSWMTQMVTESSLMDHLTNLRPGIIRFPGGSISDIYFWNGLPNQKPADAPDSLLNDAGNKIPGGYWYGKNT